MVTWCGCSYYIIDNLWLHGVAVYIIDNLWLHSVAVVGLVLVLIKLGSIPQ